jgi:hypothetical protein
MTETYRRKWAALANDLVTVAKYDPPLERTAFEELQKVARLAGDSAEIFEAVFKSGNRVLLARHLFRGDAEYDFIEPGSYLAYSHQEDSLFEIKSGSLEKRYDKDDGTVAG